MQKLGPNDLVMGGIPIAHVPFLDRFAPAARAGFKGISMGPRDLWQLEVEGKSAADARARAADHGMELREMDCICCWTPSHEKLTGDGELVQVLKSLQADPVLEAAARLGAASVTVVDMMGPMLSFDECVEGFAMLCDKAAALGLRVHIEFLPWGSIPDLMTAWRIIDAVGKPNGGLTVDTWHFFRSGSKLDDLANIPGEKIFTVQINDAPAKATANLMEECMVARLTPGKGDFDLPGFIQALDRSGSQAPIEVEVFHASLANPPIDSIAQDWAGAARALLTSARNKG
jgi:sugar phosphate isomerase/epimerase